MKRKTLSLLLVLVMAVSLFPISALATGYSDTDGHWAKTEIDKWSGAGILMGSDGSFRPDDSITRAEMATIFDRVMAYRTKAANSFTDLDNSWYTDAILRANAAGLMLGDGGTVRPNDKITRQEAAILVCRAIGLTEKSGSTAFADDSSIASWAKGYVNALSSAGLIAGVGGNRFAPTESINRASVVKMLDNAIKGFYSASGEYGQDVQGNVVVNKANVTLKNMNISGNLIIAEGVGDGDVTLDNVKVSGSVIARGGGANSIHITGGSHIGSIIIEKTDSGGIRIVSENGSVIEAVFVDDGKDDVILTGEFKDVTVAADVPVTAAGANIANVNVTGAGASLTVDGTSKVAAVTVAATAAKAEITVKGEVGSLTANAPVKVDNQGKITKAEINADNVIMDGNKPSQVVVDSSVTAPPKDSSGNTVDGSGSGGGGGGGGGGGVTPPAPTPTVGDVTIKVASVSFEGDGSQYPITALPNAAIVKITFETATEGAEIWYTTDGSDPATSETKEKYTSEEISVVAYDENGKTVVVKAIGIKSGYNNSAIKELAIVFKPSDVAVEAAYTAAKAGTANKAQYKLIADADVNAIELKALNVYFMNNSVSEDEDVKTLVDGLLAATTKEATEEENATEGYTTFAIDGVQLNSENSKAQIVLVDLGTGIGTSSWFFGKEGTYTGTSGMENDDSEHSNKLHLKDDVYFQDGALQTVVYAQDNDGNWYKANLVLEAFEDAKEGAVTAVNESSAENMGTVLAENKDVLLLNLTDYGVLTDKAPVHEALVGKNFADRDAVKAAFDAAVAAAADTELKAKFETALAEQPKTGANANTEAPFDFDNDLTHFGLDYAVEVVNGEVTIKITGEVDPHAKTGADAASGIDGEALKVIIGKSAEWPTKAAAWGNLYVADKDQNIGDLALAFYLKFEDGKYYKVAKNFGKVYLNEEHSAIIGIDKDGVNTSYKYTSGYDGFGSFTVDVSGITLVENQDIKDAAALETALVAAKYGKATAEQYKLINGSENEVSEVEAALLNKLVKSTDDLGAVKDLITAVLDADEVTFVAYEEYPNTPKYNSWENVFTEEGINFSKITKDKAIKMGIKLGNDDPYGVALILDTDDVEENGNVETAYRITPANEALGPIQINKDIHEDVLLQFVHEGWKTGEGEGVGTFIMYYFLEDGKVLKAEVNVVSLDFKTIP